MIRGVAPVVCLRDNSSVPAARPGWARKWVRGVTILRDRRRYRHGDGTGSSGAVGRSLRPPWWMMCSPSHWGGGCATCPVTRAAVTSDLRALQVDALRGGAGVQQALVVRSLRRDRSQDPRWRRYWWPSSRARARHAASRSRDDDWSSCTALPAASTDDEGCGGRGSRVRVGSQATKQGR